MIARFGTGPESFESAFDACLNAHSLPPRVRLAPTPSGYLHAGNIYNFQRNVDIARSHPDGKILLRIDDMDAARTRPEYIVNIFETLDNLGIVPDEGPKSLLDFEENWSQRLRMHLYVDALERLRAGGHLFACGLSRAELAPFGNSYPVKLRHQGLSLDDPGVNWRIKTPEGFVLPDFVVRRRGGLPAYQLASVVDDLYFDITHIVRGADLLSSTLAQKYLAQCLGAPEFQEIVILHHPLLLDEHGQKLSKSGLWND